MEKKIAQRLPSLVGTFVLATGIFLFLLPHHANALTFNVPRYGDVVGEVKIIKSKPGDTLKRIGRRHGMGYYEMVVANPALSRKNRLPHGSKVVIPSQFILPEGPRRGMVINLAELRLYYYPPGTNQVITEAVGIGRTGWDTPLGYTRIVQKTKNPTWRPTAKVRADVAKRGLILPKVVPPGPDNPLGKYSMRLGWRTYLIHSTNAPEGVGARSSAGCIRMYPEAIARLFYQVAMGSPVRVINEPYKVGWKGKKLLLEAHNPLDKFGRPSYPKGLTAFVKAKTKPHDAKIFWGAARFATYQLTGMPTEIARVR